MKAAMHCLFRYCCDADSDSDDSENEDLNEESRRSRRRRRRNQNVRHAVGPAQAVMARSAAELQPYQPAEDDNGHEEELFEQEHSTSAATSSRRNHHHHQHNLNDDADNDNLLVEHVYPPNNNDHAEPDDVCCPRSGNDSHHHQNPLGGIHYFLRRRLGFRYDVVTMDQQHAPQASHDNTNPDKKLAAFSPLRTAHSFAFCSERTTDTPTIQTEEVVLPGSELQKQMALAMQSNLLEQQQQLEQEGENDDKDNQKQQQHANMNNNNSFDECVICMEGFDDTNPRMPTLCGCGENKTSFHLPCLYQWIERNDGNGNAEDGRTCPTCRQPLTWEEF